MCAAKWHQTVSRVSIATPCVTSPGPGGFTRGTCRRRGGFHACSGGSAYDTRGIDVLLRDLSADPTAALNDKCIDSCSTARRSRIRGESAAVSRNQKSAADHGGRQTSPREPESAHPGGFLLENTKYISTLLPISLLGSSFSNPETPPSGRLEERMNEAAARHAAPSGT